MKNYSIEIPLSKKETKFTMKSTIYKFKSNELIERSLFMIDKT